jgi:hypothetical protein
MALRTSPAGRDRLMAGDILLRLVHIIYGRHAVANGSSKPPAASSSRLSPSSTSGVLCDRPSEGGKRATPIVTLQFGVCHQQTQRALCRRWLSAWLIVCCGL